VNYIYDKESARTLEEGPGGRIRLMSTTELKGMTRMSVLELELNPGGVLNPMWHANAAKVGYCTRGEVVVTIHSPGQSDRFGVRKGEIFHVPEGSVHTLENQGEEGASVKFTMNHGLPETLTLSTAVDATSAEALQSTLSVDGAFVQGLRSSKARGMLGMLKHPTPVKASFSHRLKFDIENSDKVVDVQGGYLQVGMKVNLATLEGGGILGFGVNPGGAVEPHWHPNSDEVVYITKGRVKVMLMSPDGTIERAEAGPGEGFYAPTSYFHSIEQTGSEPAEGIAFFNNPDMVYMGLGEAVGAFSDDVLASAFDIETTALDGCSKPGGPLVIVPA
jgi:oxalate decarboxylase